MSRGGVEELALESPKIAWASGFFVNGFGGSLCSLVSESSLCAGFAVRNAE